MSLEPIIILLLFSVFFVSMVLIVLYMSFHGFNSNDGNPASKEGSLVIMNFREDGPVFVKLIRDGKVIYNNFMAKETSLVLDWLESHIIEYTIATDIDLTSVIISNNLNVDQNSLVFVSINPDGTPFEMLSSRVTSV